MPTGRHWRHIGYCLAIGGCHRLVATHGLCIVGWWCPAQSGYL